MNLQERLQEYNNRHHLFQTGDKIVVGVSGGADSVCLLALLYEIRERYQLTLHVLHVNHGIRGKAAEADACFVEEMSSRMGLPFCLVKKNVPLTARQMGMTEEEAGRYVRYLAMESYREEIGADKIAVAHHRDDQAETVLFQLFRGSSPRGLAGMPPQRENIIRPLLFAGREDIEYWLAEKKMSYCQDATNQLVQYTRNKIRLKLLPYAEKEINRQAVRHIAQLAEQMTQWRDYIEKQGKAAFDRLVQKDPVRAEWLLDTEAFQKEEDVIGGEVLRLLFDTVFPGVRDITTVHYEKVCELVQMENGKELHMPGGIIVRKQYKKLRFYRQAADDGCEPLCLECKPPFRHIVDENGMIYEICGMVCDREELPAEIPQKDYTKWFDYDMIKGSVTLRNPRQGDYFTLGKSQNRKKLSRYYMDQKVPKAERATQLVLTDGAHVMWAFPGRISETYKITKNTTRVLVVTKERKPS